MTYFDGTIRQQKMISKYTENNSEFVVFALYFWPKLQNCILSLSVRIQKRVWSQRQKEFRPKTLELSHPPFYTYQFMLELNNVLAYSMLALKTRFCQAAAKLATPATTLPLPCCRSLRRRRAAAAANAALLPSCHLCCQAGRCR